MGSVRAVLFDLDHTLFDTEKTERRALRVVAKAVSVALGPRNLETYREVNTHVWSEYRAGRLTSKQLRVMRFHLWLERLGRDPRPAKGLAPLYLQHFSSGGDLIAGASQTLLSLGASGLRLGVVTNGIDRVQRRRLAASDLTHHFRAIVTSERAGITKPDPRIIEIALTRLRVSADAAAYVGDDPDVDGLAANRAGVRFVWFNPERRRLGADSSVRVDVEVTRLRELVVGNTGLLRPGG